MASTTLVIHDGAMINHPGGYGVLGIGAGNFNRGKYPDENGVEKRGATAGLWLVIGGKPETNAFYQVYPGKTIDFEGYQILVRAIGSDRRSMCVRIEVVEADGGKNVVGA
ncbi:MAG: hypothetical protein A3K46_02725 [Chloroflexi bacterium RBG_13_60_9]|nr:MAG: hypothetical protein A3K46_02725 [Chloroflexi bacterium RBG_13_60_9]